jgi:NADH:ubiquinone reductase (H+-translocating)
MDPVAATERPVAPSMPMRTDAHRIVIVGGGAGGLELATKLGNRLGRKGRATVVLVDETPTHLWKPLLHEVAAGTLNSYQDELNYIAHARAHHFRYRFGRMDGLDRARKEIRLAPIAGHAGGEIVPALRIAYDTLVIAVGSVSNDFHTPGAREHCAFLDTRAEAESLHRDLLVGVLAGVAGVADVPADGDMDVAIVGGGATGVELAAELRRMGEELSRYGVPIRPDALRITLIEAAPRILSTLPEGLAGSVRKALEGLGIRVLTGARVAGIAATGVTLADGSSIPARVKVWAAGIKAPDFLKDLDGLESNRNGQLVVRRTLQTTRDDNVFAFGDCAQCPQPGSDRPVPARAQAAHQQAGFLVGSLTRRLEGKLLPDFAYHDFGSLVSLSSYTAVGSLMGGIFRHSHRIEGRLARLAYIALYRKHQMALHGFWRTAILILTSGLQRVTQPSLKMH